MRHPIQPIVKDDHGTERFKENAIVRLLLDAGTIDMNHLACMSFTAEDRTQFAQLIGYSLSGFGDLSYVDEDTYNAACEMRNGTDEKDARIKALTDELNAIRSGLREPVARLFGIHPDDLSEETR